MQHGKKGFGRLEWAARNVLNHSVTWLFYNFNPSSSESLAEGKEPISIHAPNIRDITPNRSKSRNILAPMITVADLPGLYGQDDALSLLEWLHLVNLESPRLHAQDSIDPFLSKYEVPTFNEKGTITKDIVRVRWRGLIPPQFAREIFLLIKKEGLKVDPSHHDGEGGTLLKEEGRWFAMMAAGFADAVGWTIMQWAGRETLVWEPPR
jgi:ribonucleases P/MRP protein subunit RPP40